MPLSEIDTAFELDPFLFHLIFAALLFRFTYTVCLLRNSRIAGRRTVRGSGGGSEGSKGSEGSRGVKGAQRGPRGPKGSEGSRGGDGV